MVIGRLRGGFSLVEAEVALALLAGGLLAAAAVAGRAVRMLHEAESIDGATVAAVSVLDSLAQMKRPQPGTIVRGRYALDWMVAPYGAATRIELRIRWEDGARIRADTFTLIAAPLPRRVSRVP
jgi:hypothetical protein